MIDTILSALAPHICYGCGKIDAPLCESCTYDIVCEDYGQCIWCLRPASREHQCRACTTGVGVSGAWAAGAREGALRELVDGYKFDACREAARQLAGMLDETLPLLDEQTVVTWVPTAQVHIRERGFDHAALLARALAKRRGYRTASLLERTRSTTQHFLSRKEREQAAEGAFRARQELSDKPVLLVDDIITTGATLRACVAALQQSGAREIYVAVACRQPDR